MTDLSALKQLAKKAMPGPWMTGTSDDHWRREVRDASGHGVAWCGSNPATKAHANAAYIAACSPEVILQLCEVVEKAREVVAGWHTTVCDSAEERALRSALADLEGK